MSNLYAVAAPSDPVAASGLEHQVAKELDAKTTEDNSHPSPKDRFRLGARIDSSVVYEADAMPTGLLNRLVTSGLNIKPIN